jgi:hypothetical protein
MHVARQLNVNPAHHIAPESSRRAQDLAVTNSIAVGCALCRAAFSRANPILCYQSQFPIESFPADLSLEGSKPPESYYG